MPAGRPRSIIVSREQINIRLPQDMADEIRDMAIEGDRTFTNQMVRILREGLKVVREHNEAAYTALHARA